MCQRSAWRWAPAPIAAPAFPNSGGSWPWRARSFRWREMAASLDGLTILVPESRELDFFAELLEAEGATALRCPLVQIRDLDDTADCEAWIEQLIAGTFQDVVW